MDRGRDSVEIVEYEERDRGGGDREREREKQEELEGDIINVAQI